MYRDDGFQTDLGYLEEVAQSRVWLLVRGLCGLALGPPLATRVVLMVEVADNGSARVLGNNLYELEFDEIGRTLDERGYTGLSGQDVILEWLGHQLEGGEPVVPLFDILNAYGRLQRPETPLRPCDDYRQVDYTDITSPPPCEP